jgi:hypothetical protein
MLSPFLKKLLFVRQFLIHDGKIEILGQKQVMLPYSALSHLTGGEHFEIINRNIRESMSTYAKKIGASQGGMVKSVQDIYETMGLGKMQIIKLDTKNKVVSLRIQNIVLGDTTIIEGVLTGLFSFLFSKEFGQNNIEVQKKASHFQVNIK